jgi:hypothetical protein
LNRHANTDHCQCQRCARNRIEINEAPAEVVEVPIPNDDFGDVFGGDDCVVLERRTATTRRPFLGGLSNFPRLPSSIRNGAVPNTVFITVTVQPRPMLARPSLFFAAVPPPSVQLAVAWPVGVLPFAQRKPEALVIPTLAGTKHDYERPKMQIAYCCQL